MRVPTARALHSTPPSLPLSPEAAVAYMQRISAQILSPMRSRFLKSPAPCAASLTPRSRPTALQNHQQPLLQTRARRLLSTTPRHTMRLPYAPTTPPADPSPSNPDPAATAAIYARIAARRAPRPLIPLDLALLHSPPVADGWNAFLGAIRSQTVVDPAVLELAISRVGALTDAAWEWRAHSALAAKAGVGRAVLEWLLLKEDVDAIGAEGVAGMGEREKAVVRYTDAMTKGVAVPEGVFDGLRAHFAEREIVELTTAVAAYNCVSRVLVALDVGEMNGKKLEVPAEAK
ncbi:AhpD-like protein [Macrophomina phaseolina]|uniref:AhpD-like protein n=1 Tax=Macrophomina phaseolina TaxID=35725 RepID=A0ABQ8GKN2_9PEZI|nr:AhpD-like protein [Macrophomina phaseolina]